LQAPQGRSDPLYGGTSAPGARATGATDGWWWQHLRAPLGVARLHVLPCLHGREHGSTVHLKRIPEGPCAMARRRHGAHRRHGALGARRPSSAALRVNDPRTISKVVCPRPPRTSRCCSAVPVAVEAQPRASTAGKSSNLERRGRANVPSTGRRTLGFSAH